MDPPIHTENFHSHEATTQKFIVTGATTVSSFVMRSIISWKMVVPLDNTTFACDSLKMSTSHFMLLCQWKRLEQQFHATETFGTDCDDVFVWGLVGLLAGVHVTLRVALEGTVVDNPSTQRRRSEKDISNNNGNMQCSHKKIIWERQSIPSAFTLVGNHRNQEQCSNVAFRPCPSTTSRQTTAYSFLT